METQMVWMYSVNSIKHKMLNKITNHVSEIWFESYLGDVDVKTFIFDYLHPFGIGEKKYENGLD